MAQIMFDVLDKLIEYILETYTDMNILWQSSDKFNDINLKKKQVIEIPDDEVILNTIKDYRVFMELHQFEILKKFRTAQTDKTSVTCRVKCWNSIEYKIYKYINGPLEGRMSINKCFNDLFGIRIIINDNFSHEDIKKHLDQKFPDLKFKDSSNNGYIGSHIYFMGGNKYFPWELQIWKRSDEKNNLESHKIYKQGYTSWENNCKHF